MSQLPVEKLVVNSNSTIESTTENILSVNSKAIAVKLEGDGAPGTDINPERLYQRYYDYTNKVEYMCTDITGNANVWEPIQITGDQKTKLDGIEAEANKYVLPADVVQDANYVHLSRAGHRIYNGDNNSALDQHQKMKFIGNGVTAINHMVGEYTEINIPGESDKSIVINATEPGKDIHNSADLVGKIWIPVHSTAISLSAKTETGTVDVEAKVNGNKIAKVTADDNWAFTNVAEEDESDLPTHSVVTFETTNASGQELVIILRIRGV